MACSMLLLGIVCIWWRGNPQKKCSSGKCVPEDAGRNVASTADSDHEIGLKVIEDLIRSILAEFVDLQSGRVSVVFPRALFATKQEQEKEKKGNKARASRRRFGCKVCVEVRKSKASHRLAL